MFGNILDKCLITFDNFLYKATTKNKNSFAPRENPANKETLPKQLSEEEKQDSIAMMKINHSGEVCAQALYQGQALTSRNKKLYKTLLESCHEEIDHLKWCEERLGELGAKPSLFNPIWHAGSLGIGMLAGLCGDKYSLGFLAETEFQVEKHITKHLAQIPANDTKSRAILEQMRKDELKHATTALNSGGLELPNYIKVLMKFSSKILTLRL